MVKITGICLWLSLVLAATLLLDNVHGGPLGRSNRLRRIQKSRKRQAIEVVQLEDPGDMNESPVELFIEGGYDPSDPEKMRVKDAKRQDDGPAVIYFDPEVLLDTPEISDDGKIDVTLDTDDDVWDESRVKLPLVAPLRQIDNQTPVRIPTTNGSPGSSAATPVTIPTRRLTTASTQPAPVTIPTTNGSPGSSAATPVTIPTRSGTPAPSQPTPVKIPTINPPPNGTIGPPPVPIPTVSNSPTPPTVPTPSSSTSRPTMSTIRTTSSTPVVAAGRSLSPVAILGAALVALILLVCLGFILISAKKEKKSDKQASHDSIPKHTVIGGLEVNAIEGLPVSEGMPAKERTPSGPVIVDKAQSSESLSPNEDPKKFTSNEVLKASTSNEGLEEPTSNASPI